MSSKIHKTCLPARQGFTLIELLVAMSVVMIIGGFVLSNYTKFNQAQLLKQSALTLKNNLRFAQNKATTGQKPASGCSQLLGYQVTFTSSSYDVQAICTEGTAGENVSIQLPTGIQFSPIPSPIIFGVLTRGVASDVLVTVSNSSRNYIISISRSGDINDMGFQ